MNFDFSALNFETIDSNINAYPDMFLNQNGVTFTKKVLEDLGYPAFVLCLLDAKVICTPFTGHPVEGVLLCGTHMSTKGNV